MFKFSALFRFQAENHGAVLPFNRIVATIFTALVVFLVITPQSAASPNDEFKYWSVPNAQDVYTSGLNVYLQIGKPSKPEFHFDPLTDKRLAADHYLNPLTNEMLTSEQVGDSLDRLIEIDQPITLANGVKVTQNILSLGASCGLTVGVSYTMTAPSGAQTNLWYVRKLPPGQQHTDYCGVPLQQEYDSPCCVMFAALKDGQILMIDFMSQLAISFSEMPTVPISIGGKAFLIPGALLDRSLSYKNQNQRLRYEALMHVLRTSPIRQAVLQNVSTPSQ